jgi:AbrB family looped-hinge helix DNA binding protein
MNQVTVTSKYMVVIPLELRKRLGIRKGQKMSMVAIGKRIQMVPVPDIRDMAGAFPGLTSEGIRDEEDRF